VTDVGKRRSYLRGGLFSLLVALAFVGYGLFRYGERHVLGGALVFVGLLNLVVSAANFVLAFWDSRDEMKG